MMNIGSFLKITGCVLVVEIVLEISRYMYCRFKYNCDPKSLTFELKKLYSEPNDKNSDFNKVIFFPDPGIACRRMLSGRVCHDQHCSAIHDKTSLSVLLNVINLSRRTLDVCVYMITCAILGDALVDCQKRGIILRIITEERNSGEEGEMSGSQIGKLRAAEERNSGEEGEMSGSQIGKLRAAAIQIRCKASSFWMHHKFLIADNEVLVNGSFNWTNQAVMGNSENLIITNEKDLVEPFVSEFQKLWDDLSVQEFLEDEDIKNCNF